MITWKGDFFMRRKAISLCLSVLFVTTIFAGCSSAKDSAVGSNNKTQVQQSENNNKKDQNNSSNESENKDADKNDNASASKPQSNTEENVNISSFSVNGSYTTTSSSNDLGEDIKYLKGNGSAYQVIGTTGKGNFVRVYNVKSDGIYEVFSDDIDDSKSGQLSSLNYLDKSGSKQTLVLKAPVKVGTRWDNKEIVEVGKNLKVAGITFKGNYAKVWERTSDNTTKVSYYCEGYGCVKYNVMHDKATVSYFNYSKLK